MSWTYRCLRPKCGGLFSTEKPANACPSCRSKSIRWVPCSVAVSSKRAGIDRELREIATNYGLSDLRSARAGESAAPRKAAPAHTMKWSPAPGMGTIDVARDPSTGAPLATAGWTGDTVRVTGVSRPINRSPAMLPGARTHIEARDTSKLA